MAPCKRDRQLLSHRKGPHKTCTFGSCSTFIGATQSESAPCIRDCQLLDHHKVSRKHVRVVGARCAQSAGACSCMQRAASIMEPAAGADATGADVYAPNIEVAIMIGGRVQTPRGAPRLPPARCPPHQLRVPALAHQSFRRLRREGPTPCSPWVRGEMP